MLLVEEVSGAPFDTLVLRDHVLLAARNEDGGYFEVLERGRRLSGAELNRAEPERS